MALSFYQTRSEGRGKYSFGCFFRNRGIQGNLIITMPRTWSGLSLWSRRSDDGCS